MSLSDDGLDSAAHIGAVGRRGFGWWLISYEASIVPPAMAPVAFGTAAVAAGLSSRTGAALVCAMLVGQVLFAVPVERLARVTTPRNSLMALLMVQAVGLCTLALAVERHDPLVRLLVLACISGVPSGVIFGLFRLILAQTTPRDRLLQRVATSLSVNEVVYISLPIFAGYASARFATLPVLIMAAAGTLSTTLVSRLASVKSDWTDDAESAVVRNGWVWLACMFMATAALGFVEVGAVGIALELGWPTKVAGFIAAASAVTSGLAGAFVSWRNPPASPTAVLSLLVTTVVGTFLVVVATVPWMALLGCLLIGVGVAPLGTFLSELVHQQVLDREFARAMSVLRSAHGLGFVFAAVVLAAFSVREAGVLVAVTITILGVICTFGYRRRQRLGPHGTG